MANRGFPSNGKIQIGSTGAQPVEAVPTNGTNISWTAGAGSLTANLSGQVAVANGGTGQSTLTNHGVLVGAATSAITQLPAGTANTILRSGGASADPSWSTATYPDTAGTSGNLLASNGTNFTSQSAATLGSSLVLIASTAASNQATVTFTGLTTYNSYLLVVENFQPITNGSYLRMRTSSNGGSSYDTTGYKSGLNYFVYTSATLTNQNSTTGFDFSNNVGNAQTQNAIAYLFNINVGSFVQVVGHTVYTDSSANLQIGWNGGSGTTGVNAIQFLTSSGNINAGTFTLYGLKKS